jgi:hypothetical protein
MSSNYYCDLKGIFHVVAMIGDQVDSDFDPEDLMDVQERYGGQLPDSYCMRDPYAQRRMTFRFVTIVTFLTSSKFIIIFLFMGVRRGGQGGALAPPWPAKAGQK